MKEIIKRIEHNEALFDEAILKLKQIQDCIQLLNDLEEIILKLKEYQESGNWMDDFLLDEQGLLPIELKRGILSEDGLYDLISDYQDLKEELLAILTIK